MKQHLWLVDINNNLYRSLKERVSVFAEYEHQQVSSGEKRWMNLPSPVMIVVAWDGKKTLGFLDGLDQNMEDAIVVCVGAPYIEGNDYRSRFLAVFENEQEIVPAMEGLLALLKHHFIPTNNIGVVASHAGEGDFRLITQHSFLGFYRADFEGDILAMNPAMEKFLGIKYSLGLKFDDLQRKGVGPSLSRDFVMNKLKDVRILEDEESIWIGHQDDKPVFVRESMFVDPSGAYYESVVQIVSLCKKQEILREIMESITRAIHDSQDIHQLARIIRKDLSNVFDTNNFLIALYNEEKDVLSIPLMVDDKDSFNEFPAGKTLTRYIIKNDIPLLASCDYLYELEKKGVIDLVGTPAKIWMGVPLKSSGVIVGALVVQHYHDEHAYKAADLEVMKYISGQLGIAIDKKSAEDELRNSERKFRDIIRQLSEGICIVNSSGIILEWNTAQEKMLGIGHKEAVGYNILEVQARFNIEKEEHSNGFGAFRQFLSTCLLEENADWEMASFEFSLITMDEHVRYLSIKVFPIVSEAQQLIGVLTYDVTSIVSNRHELEKARDMAQESDKLKMAFLANMSHEIRTPINAIVGFSSLLLEPEISSNERLEYMDIVRDNSDMLMQLINDIIDLAKIEAGETIINKSQFDVNKLFEQLYRSYGEKMDRSKVQLVYDNEERGPLFYDNDEIRMRQVMGNLLGNAIKFTDEGAIHFGFQLQDGQIWFYVKDSGIGIPSAQHERIFDRFCQVDSSNTREHGGTGLGLAITRSLTELMGGIVKMQSEPGKGSEFYVIFPLHVPIAKEEKRHQSVLDEKTSIANKTVLVVEDVDSNFRYINAVLKKTGVKILWAKNGQQGVDIVKDNSAIDIVLMDIHMPVMNGVDACRAIKKLRFELPVIIQTADVMRGERDKCIEAGSDDFIAKPIRARDLIQKIEHYLK